MQISKTLNITEYKNIIMKNEIYIAGKLIGQTHPPFVIAEMSGNHGGSLERALMIVRAAAKSGVQALKLQTFTADTMTLDINKGEFLLTEQDSLWKGKTLYELYSEASTPLEWHKPIFELCNELGMIAFSTPFDETAVDYLEDLGVPCYKVSSFENTDIPLIRRIAETGKPMLISTGMATLEELGETVNEARRSGCREIVLLKCTSSYPASPDDINLMTIPHMMKSFNVQVGLSDHTLGTAVPVAGISLGVTVIEKHFTLSRTDGGTDAGFSLEPSEMNQLVNDVNCAWRSLGSVHYGPAGKECQSLKYRRSIYVVKNISVGEILTSDNVRSIRPGFGLAPRHLPDVLGMRTSRDLTKGTPLSWDLIMQ